MKSAALSLTLETTEVQTMRMHVMSATVLGLLLYFAVPAHATGAEPADNRPNILFALADDWAWPHAGVYGDKVVQTPTFDRVAASGMLFSHCFTTCPSCTP